MCFHRLEQSRCYTGTGLGEYREAPQLRKTPLTSESSDVSHFHECTTLPAWVCVRVSAVLSLIVITVWL